MGNAASSVPTQFQSGAFNGSFSCAATIAQLLLSATAPISAGAGQGFYFSDISGQFNLAPDYNDYEKENGATTYRANITITLRYANPDDTFTIVQPFYAPVDDVIIPIEKTGSLGPISGQGGITDLQIQSVNISAIYYGSNGLPQSIIPNSEICTSSPLYILTSTSILSDISGPTIPPQDGVAQFPQLGQKATKANLTLDCQSSDTSLEQTTPFYYELDATYPAVLPANGPYKINVNNYLKVPGQLVYDLTANSSGGPTSGLFVTLGNFEGENTTEPDLGFQIDGAIIDLARDFSEADSSTPNPLQTGEYLDTGSTNAITFPLPRMGTTTFDLMGGTNNTRSIGQIINLQARLDGYTEGVGAVRSEDIFCKPIAPSVLVRAPEEVVS